MQPSQARFVTVCQQLLVLGVVLAVLTPAAGVISLDVVPSRPGARPAAAAPLAEYARSAAQPVLVPTAAVEPEVDEYRLTAPRGARVAPGGLRARTVVGRGSSRVTSEPQPVSGYGAVGVTWQPGQQYADEEIEVSVRYRDSGRWSDWSPVHYDADHGPDPTSPEARNARPGTDAVLVGEVEKVQVRVAADTSAPTDLRLSVVDPGAAPTSARELPDIDTAELDPAAPAVDPAEGGPDALVPAAATYTPRPKIFSRAQWGADERMRSSRSLSYHEVHAGFVHHTVNANNYTAAQVPGLLRGIYAYHTRSRGWSDIGYNFLVDRFGRIWEGRYGGVDRAVVGAHTLGYNENSFAMSAIGNFDTAKPNAKVVQAYGALFGWKLSLHGVNAASARQVVGSRTFRAINGHRDAGSTACPGRYLYAKLARIRTLASKVQRGFAGRQLESNLAGNALPDLVVRRASDKQVMVIPLRRTKDGRYKTRKAIGTGLVLSNADRIMNGGDWDRDGHADLLERHRKNGGIYFRPGLGNGRFGPVRLLGKGFKGVRMLAAVGDFDGDGWPDLMGQPKGQPMRIYPGRGAAGFRPSYVVRSSVPGNRMSGAGLWDGDGASDTLVRQGRTLRVWHGNGPGGLTGSRDLPLDMRGYDWFTAISDVGLGGHPDLVVRVKGTGQLWLLHATATGFGHRELLGRGLGAYDLIG